jgi:hypothetical protein
VVTPAAIAATRAAHVRLLSLTTVVGPVETESTWTPSGSMAAPALGVSAPASTVNA